MFFRQFSIKGAHKREQSKSMRKEHKGLKVMLYACSLHTDTLPCKAMDGAIENEEEKDREKEEPR